jgi:hypothetical protein
MTSLPALIDEVHALGAELVVIGGVVKLIGDRSQVSPDLRERLHAVRDVLLDEFRPHVCPDCGMHWFRQAGTVCYWCQGKRAGQP